MEKSKDMTVEMSEGKPFEMFCATNSPNEDINFEECRWSQNVNGVHEWCFKTNGIPCNQHHEDDNLVARPLNHECRIEIKSPTTKHSGNWTCKLTDPSGNGKVAFGVIYVQVYIAFSFLLIC